MASTSNTATNFAEEDSTTRPPLYTGTDYTYWKMRMLNYLLAVDVDAYRVIFKGPKIPMKKDKDGGEVPKPQSEWTREDYLVVSINAKALNYLYCAIDKSQIDKLSKFSNAFDLWKSLEIVNEGTSQIKEFKINRFMYDLDNFKMEVGEDIEGMISRFTMIVSQLSALRKNISMSDQVKKILSSLPKEYRIYAAIIKISNDVNTLQLDELVGKLLEFEMEIKNDLREEEESKRIKNLALKSSVRIDDSESSSDGDDSDDEDVALLIRNFKRFLNYNKRNKGKFRKNGKKEDNRPWKHKNEQITCFECKKPGHKVVDCPMKKSKKKFKKRAMKTTWSDSDSSSSNEEDEKEMRNLAFMAIKDDDLLD